MAALGFLTVLGGPRAPDRQTLAWFPAAGALIGAGLGCTWWAADRGWSAPVAAALVVVADLALTGMLHLDGLVDAADGLLPHLDRERRLAVMAEPTVGAFGIGAALAVVVLRVAAIVSMTPDVLLLAALWCTSRTVMAVAGRAVPSARPGGMAHRFAGGDWRPVAASGAALLTALAVVAGPVALASVVVAVAAGAAVVLFARRRLGGITGDVLGATGMVAETAGLLAAAGRW